MAFDSGLTVTLSPEGETGDAPAQSLGQRPEFRAHCRALSDFEGYISARTGTFDTPDRVEKRNARRAELKAQADELADALDSLGIGGRRKEAEGWSIWRYLIHSGDLERLASYRRICLNPYIAAVTRSEKLAAAEYFEERQTFGLRFLTFTTGARCTVKRLRKRLEWLHRQLSKLNAFWARKRFPIQMVLRSSELGSLEDAAARRAGESAEKAKRRQEGGELSRDSRGRALYHPHSHCLCALTRLMDKPEWDEFLRQTKAFWHHNWDEGGRIKNIREAVKYVTKPAQIVALARRDPAELAALFEATARIKMVQPMGALRREMTYRRKNHLSLVRVSTPDGNVWREIKDPHKGHSKGSEVIKTIRQTFTGRAARNRSAGGPCFGNNDHFVDTEITRHAFERLERVHHAGFRRPDRDSLPDVCRVVSRCMPAPGPLGVREPAAIIMGTKFDRSAVDRHPLIARLRNRTRTDWLAGVRMARAAWDACLSVHTGTPTVPTLLTPGAAALWREASERPRRETEPIFAHVA